MKRIMTVVISLNLISCLHADNRLTRLTKKDKEDLMQMINDPISGMQRSIAELNEVAQQIQNFILDVTVNADHQDAKQCCHKILAHVKELELILQLLAQEIAAEREVIGNLDDQSVGEEEFNSVQDIDDAELSVISWLKTVYREQLRDKFIS